MGCPGQFDDPLNGLGRHGVILSSRFRARCEPGHAAVAESSPNPRHRFRRHVQPPSDLGPFDAIGAPQDDLRPAHFLRWRDRAAHHPRQLAPLLRRDHHRHTSSHATLDEGMSY